MHAQHTYLYTCTAGGYAKACAIWFGVVRYTLDSMDRMMRQYVFVSVLEFRLNAEITFDAEYDGQPDTQMYIISRIRWPAKRVSHVALK